MKGTKCFMLVALGVFFYTLPATSDNASAEQAIRAEKIVKDMLFQSDAAIKWQVGVLDNGSKRWGYASYLCGVLLEHGVVTKATKPGEEIVRIVDISKIVRGIGFRKASLGAVDCVSYEKLMP